MIAFARAGPIPDKVCRSAWLAVLMSTSPACASGACGAGAWPVDFDGFVAGAFGAVVGVCVA
jgi:hypothetical protein